ncbi:hypothetical protein [Salinarimonas sp.]|uniref:hypothetical protein n=1 Tax=Salinarimonas sp. TaxID=2766526 RepID=UPI00391B9EDE
MQKKTLIALSAALMIGAAPAAIAQVGTTGEAGAGQAPGMQQPGTVMPLERMPPATIEAAPQIDTQATIDEERVRELLEARGVTDVEDLERGDDGFYTASATWYGEDVDLRIDGVSGVIVEPERLNEDQIAYVLEEEGFSEVSDIEREGEFYTATAERDDSEYRVRVDARTGAVIEEEEA